MYFNITLKELKKAVLYAEEKGVSEHKTITIHCTSCHGIGGLISVSQTPDAKKENISNISAW